MFNNHPGVRLTRSQLEQLVLNHSLGPGAAADILISQFIAKK
jgi:triphosphoribosyl-dephospho-CoA synthetase